MIANGAQLLSTIADEVFELHDRRLSGDSIGAARELLLVTGSFVMGVSKNRGKTQNGWFIMEHLLKMDDLGGKHTIFGNIHM